MLLSGLNCCGLGGVVSLISLFSVGLLGSECGGKRFR